MRDRRARKAGSLLTTWAVTAAILNSAGAAMVRGGRGTCGRDGSVHGAPDQKEGLLAEPFGGVDGCAG
jgi:hypothetical protein